MTKSRSRRRKNEGNSPENEGSGHKRETAKSEMTKVILTGLVIILAMTNMITYAVLTAKIERLKQESSPAAVAAPETPSQLAEFRVVNAHDHLYMRKHLDKYLAAARKCGIVRTLFVASSDYTLKGSGNDPAKGNDWNTEEILRAAKEFPTEIVPFCTIHPRDPEKLEKIRKYVAEGAKGLKLYTGHGNFYDRPLDAEEMLPIYEYCEQTNLPICWHVNLVEYKDEFSRVMAKYPKLTVIVPHFGVTFYQPTGPHFIELQTLLDTYPNLYTDTSFGTRNILVQGLEKVSQYPEIFRAFCIKYSDRIFFGTDMVVTGNKEKTTQWIEAVLRACRDVLEKDRYSFYMAAAGSPYAAPQSNNVRGELRGLALPEEVLRKIYETNFEKLFPTQPTAESRDEEPEESEE